MTVNVFHWYVKRIYFGISISLNEIRPVKSDGNAHTHKPHLHKNGHHQNRIAREWKSHWDRLFSQILTFNNVSTFFFFVVVVVAHFNIFICYKVLFSFMCHISIIYSGYVYHIFIYFGNINVIRHMLRDILRCVYSNNKMREKKSEWNARNFSNLMLNTF